MGSVLLPSLFSVLLCVFVYVCLRPVFCVSSVDTCLLNIPNPGSRFGFLLRLFRKSKLPNT